MCGIWNWCLVLKFSGVDEVWWIEKYVVIVDIVVVFDCYIRIWLFGFVEEYESLGVSMIFYFSVLVIVMFILIFIIYGLIKVL